MPCGNRPNLQSIEPKNSFTSSRIDKHFFISRKTQVGQEV